MFGFTQWNVDAGDKTVTIPQVKENTVPEIASFEYIEQMLDKALAKKTEPSKAQRDEAKKASREVVAGFPVYDEAKERAALDAFVAQREKAITAFIEDRKAVRKKLGDLGVEPLAVVPIKAWNDICTKADLMILQPDTDGRISLNGYNIQNEWKQDKDIEAAARVNHNEYVRKVLSFRDVGGMYGARGAYKATIVLPEPPADVIEKLIKVKSLSLKTAAVLDAIRFAETPTQIRRGAVAAWQAYQDWIKNEPIIYHEHGTAAAIIAQFGDFVIEKQAVDAAMEADELIPNSVGQALISPAMDGRSVSLAEYARIYGQQPQFPSIFNTTGGGTGGLSGLAGDYPYITRTYTIGYGSGTSISNS